MSQRYRDDRGTISIWLATISLAMVMLVGLAVDLGGQVHAQQRAHNIAAQAARAAGEQVRAAPAISGHAVLVEATAARNAAQDYLAASDVAGSVAITDGDTITVSVTDIYRPKFLGVIGLGDVTVTGEATARLIRSFGGNER